MNVLSGPLIKSEATKVLRFVGDFSVLVQTTSLTFVQYQNCLSFDDLYSSFILVNAIDQMVSRPDKFLEVYIDCFHVGVLPRLIADFVRNVRFIHGFDSDPRNRVITETFLRLGGWTPLVSSGRLPSDRPFNVTEFSTSNMFEHDNIEQAAFRYTSRQVYVLDNVHDFERDLMLKHISWIASHPSIQYLALQSQDTAKLVGWPVATNAEFSREILGALNDPLKKPEWKSLLGTTNTYSPSNTSVHTCIFSRV